MSAGTGIQHEEWNLDKDDTRLFQIWIEPNKKGLRPRWEQAAFPKGERKGRLVPLASGRADAPADALWIAQDASILGATLDAGQEVTLDLGLDRLAYLVPAKGTVTVNGIAVPERAGAAIKGEQRLVIRADTDAEILVADLPPA
jgi:redox-sensitive bicupin YhaK (pirin superfamily)